MKPTSLLRFFLAGLLSNLAPMALLAGLGAGLGPAQAAEVSERFAGVQDARLRAVLGLDARVLCGVGSAGWQDFVQADGGKVRARERNSGACISWTGYATADEAINAMHAWCDGQRTHCDLAYSGGYQPAQLAQRAVSPLWR